MMSDMTEVKEIEADLSRAEHDFRRCAEALADSQDQTERAAILKRLEARQLIVNKLRSELRMAVDRIEP